MGFISKNLLTRIHLCLSPLPDTTLLQEKVEDLSDVENFTANLVRVVAKVPIIIIGVTAAENIDNNNH